MGPSDVLYHFRRTELEDMRDGRGERGGGGSSSPPPPLIIVKGCAEQNDPQSLVEKKKVKKHLIFQKSYSKY